MDFLKPSPWVRTAPRLPFIHVVLGPSGPEASGENPCLLGHRISRNGGPADGIWANWSWDGRRLEAANDRYGFCPLYYFADDRQVYLSNSIPRLLAAGAPTGGLDDDAIAVFLRLGFFVGEDTAFRSIRSLPPSAELVWADGKLSVRGAPVSIPEDRSVSREEAFRRYDDLFRRSMERRMPGEDYAIPLSGGRDSRHILLELCRMGRPPLEAVTVDVEENADAAGAAAIARHCGVPSRCLARAPIRLSSELRKNMETSYSTVDHSWALPMADYLSRYRWTFDGIAGDVLSAGHFLTEARDGFYRRGEFRRLAEHLIEKTDASAARYLSPAALRRWSRPTALTKIEAELVRHRHAANPTGMFFLSNRTRRAVSVYSYGMMRRCDNVFSPFLDHELFDFLASLPAAMVMDHNFHTEMIARTYPHAAEVPYGRKSVYRPRVAMAGIFEALGYVLAGKGRRFLRAPMFAARLAAAALAPWRRGECAWLYSPLAIMSQLHELEGG